MTTTRKPTNCSDCGTKLTSSTRTPDHTDLCAACYDYAGWENTHDDEGHDDMGNGSVDNDIRSHCPVCKGEAPTAKPAKAGHSNGKPLSHTSHAGHDHPATKAARAACRKAAAKG